MPLCEPAGDLLLGGVGSALLAEADDGGDEAAVVLHALVGAAPGLLLLVLLRHLGRLSAHLSRARQRSVHLSCTTDSRADGPNARIKSDPKSRRNGTLEEPLRAGSADKFRCVGGEEEVKECLPMAAAARRVAAAAAAAGGARV